jgi:hypothetical protein
MAVFFVPAPHRKSTSKDWNVFDKQGEQTKLAWFAAARKPAMKSKHWRETAKHWRIMLSIFGIPIFALGCCNTANFFITKNFYSTYV